MSHKPAWGVELPALPEGLRFEIKVVPNGTYVRVTENTMTMHTAKPLMERFVESTGWETRDFYLTKIWGAMTFLALGLKDRDERAEWLKEVWELAE